MLHRADFLRQRGGFFGVLVGHRDEAYCRMSRSQLCAQPADAARTDDGQTQCFTFDDLLRIQAWPAKNVCGQPRSLAKHTRRYKRNTGGELRVSRNLPQHVEWCAG